MQKKNPHPDPAHVAELRTAAEFDAVASPVRDQILQVVVNQAPTAPGLPEPLGISIKEIGEQLGRKPASLYRHIDTLLNAGLIKETGAHTSGGRDATAYAATAQELHMIAPKRQGKAMDALCKYLERTAAHAGKEAVAATRDRTKNDPPYDDGSIAMSGWLDQHQRARMKALLTEVAAIYENANRRPGTKLMATTMFIRPVRLPGNAVAQEPQADEHA